MAVIKIDEGGSVNLNTVTRQDGAPLQRFMSLDIPSTINFLRTLAVRQPDLRLDYFGLYTMGTFSKNGEVRWASLTMPKYILQSRVLGCAWNPQGASHADVVTALRCKFTMMMEQCPDAYGECLEGLLGTGRDVHDVLATPAGQALFQEFVSMVFTALGNSIHLSTEFGQHPLTTDADTNDTYTIPPDQWEDYKANQAICRGRITHIDYYKALAVAGDTTYDNFNVEIVAGDIDATDRTLYIGNPSELFRKQIKTAPADFRSYIRSVQPAGLRPIFEVTRSIFEALREEILSKYNTIPATFYLFYSGKFCEASGCISTEPITDTLLWDGYVVIARDNWDEWAEVHDLVMHRSILSAPGVYGLAFDVLGLSQWDGIGMNITQKLEAPYMGKVFLDTAFDSANAILKLDWISNASLIEAA